MDKNQDKLPILEMKSFEGHNFTDYWGLKEHPLFVKLNKNAKPYLRFDEEYFLGSTKVNSLSALANFLRANEWTAQKKYLENIRRTIAAAIGIPCN